MNWGVDIEEDVVRSYKFSYDGLNRLTKAMYTEENADEDTNYDPDYTVNYGYDKMGNLVLLKRYGLSEVISGQLYYELIDELTMEYTGNQLRKLLTNPHSTQFMKVLLIMWIMTIRGSRNFFMIPMVI